MRIDRQRFLALAAALSACHGAQTREPARGAREGGPPAGLAAAAATGAHRPHAGDAVGGGAAAKVVTVHIPAAADGGSAAAGAGTAAEDEVAGEPPSRQPSSLQGICRSLTPNAEYCGDESDWREPMCRTFIAEYRPAVARDAVQCLAGLESSCDNCGIRQCAVLPLERAWAKRPAGTTPQYAECAMVRRRAEQELGDGTEYAELCTRYAYGMNRKGRGRFTRCLAGSIGIGIRYCLWDPSATPCTEGSGSAGRPFGPSDTGF